MGQILLLGIGGALGGVLSIVPIIPLGFWLGFLYPEKGQSLGEAVVYSLLILVPGLGMGGLLIGLGLGLGVVLGREQSFSLEAISSAMGGFLGGSFIAGYFCLFKIFDLVINPAVIMAAFGLVAALVAGPIVYCVRRMKRLLKRGQTVGQIATGAIAGAAIGTLGDVILHSFPYTLAAGACFGAGLVAGLSWAEHWSEVERERSGKGID